MFRLRLLLVEDSDEDAQLVIHTLSKAGYDVAASRVDTPQALAAALDQNTWDLAIADYTMPRFSGTAALKLVRERDAEMPFIFVSGTIGEDVAVAAMRTGAHDYIMKGNLKRLAPAVERELREAAVRRDRKRANERLVHLAYHDPLTDLPNRALLHDRLGQAVLIARRDRKPLSILVMDLDGFKMINDALGHHVGDRVLQHVSARLRGTLRESDTVARLGGDEFAVILPFTGIDGASLAAQKLLRELERPLVIDDCSMTVRASIGIAECPEHGSNADTLLQKADVAMYVAKRDNSGYAAYTPERDRYAHRRLTLLAELRHGLETGQLFVEYQPIVHLHTGLSIGVEALARWNHPQQGRLQAAEFIDLAERAGLDNSLTAFVLDCALAHWSNAPRPLTVAVNLSSRSLHDQQLPDRLSQLLRARGAPASSLAIEVTENIIMSDPTRSLECLKRVHEMGVRIVVDDYGTGFSSLSYLRRLPVDEVKIDRLLVSRLGTTDDEMIVRSLIDLAHNLGLTVIAEGVETQAALDRLIALRCDAAQGIFISEPGPVERVREWIAGRDLAT